MLPPRYFYQVGDGSTWGPLLSFRSLKAPGQDYPQRLLVLGDWCARHKDPPGHRY
jgi:hypothetical protein